MKTVSMIASLVVLLISTACCATSSEKQILSFPPLPEHFDGITKCGNPDFRPAAIYRVRDGKIAFCCMGMVVPTGLKTYSAIVPEHIFSKSQTNKEVFGVRTAHPDSHGLVGYINDITWKSSEGTPKDIVIADVGTNVLPVESFSKTPAATPIIYYGAREVVIHKKLSRRIYSKITGKEVRILGYGVTPTKEFDEAQKNPDLLGKLITVVDKNPLIAVEINFKPGDSGHPFFDEHGRYYIGHAGDNPDSSKSDKITIRQINKFLIENGEKPATAYGFITGPIDLEPEHAPALNKKG